MKNKLTTGNWISQKTKVMNTQKVVTYKNPKSGKIVVVSSI